MVRERSYTVLVGREKAFCGVTRELWKYMRYIGQLILTTDISNAPSELSHACSHQTNHMKHLLGEQ